MWRSALFILLALVFVMGNGRDVWGQGVGSPDLGNRRPVGKTTVGQR